MESVAESRVGIEEVEGWAEELERVRRKLANSDFLAKAKEEVLRREKEKAEEFEDKIRTLNLSLGRIREIEQMGEKA